MPWGEAPSGTITIPGTAGPGEARIVIGPDLPPPLNTYLFGSSDLAVGGIIFYNGGDDTDYQFIVEVPAATLESIFMGSVVNGAVLDDGLNNPRGLEYAADVNTLLTTWKMTSQLIQILPDPAGGGRAQVGDQLLVIGQGGDNDLTGTAGTTTSATFVDFPGPVEATMVKVYAGSKFQLEFHASLTSTAINTVVEFAIGISGVTGAGDYEVGRFGITTANQRVGFSNKITGNAGDLGDGTVVGRLRWRRVSGAGTLTITAGQDSSSVALAEVPIVVAT